MTENTTQVWRRTTILGVRRNGQTVIAGDGQVTLNDLVVKGGAKKVRRLADGAVIAGFAGSAADGMALFDRFEARLKESNSHLTRAAVEMAKDWRTDKALRRLQAMMIVADRQRLLLISGTGDVIDPDEGVVGIGSGGAYAVAASRALLRNTELPAREIVVQSMRIAAELCVYTNDQITIEELQ